MRTVASRGTIKAVTPMAPAPTPVSVTNTPKATQQDRKNLRRMLLELADSGDEIVEDMLAEE